MAYVVRAEVTFAWVPDGAGSAFLGQAQSNNPGIGPNQGPGPVPVSQSLVLFQGEVVPGGDSPTQANFNTALSSLAADIESQMGEAGAAFGQTGTPLSIIQAWASGGPTYNQ